MCLIIAHSLHIADSIFNEINSNLLGCTIDLIYGVQNTSSRKYDEVMVAHA